MDNKEELIAGIINEAIDSLRRLWDEDVYLSVKDEFNKYWSALDLMTIKENITKPEVSVEIISKICTKKLLAYNKNYNEITGAKNG